MRSKEDIIKAILINIGDQSEWQRLQYGIVGKELLSWAAAVVQENEAVRDSVSDMLSWQTADKRQLINLAHFSNVCIDFDRPYTISVVNPQKLSYGPYKLVGISGSTSYYNIDYTNESIITLYQGVLKSTNTSKVPGSIEAKAPDAVWTSMTVDVNVVRNGYKISKCIVDSVIVYDSATFSPMALSTVSNTNSEQRTYSLMNLPDGSVFVYVGDGMSSKPYDHIYISYIEPTFKLVDLSAIKFSKSQTVTSNTDGKEDDLEYARASYYTHLSSHRGIVSEQQLVNYCKAQNYIQDVSIHCINNEAHIYVKPIGTPATYLDLYTKLKRYGVMGTEYYIASGTKVPIKLKIKLETDTDQNRTAVSSAINKEFSYENMPYSWTPQVSDINAVASKAANVVSVKMQASSNDRVIATVKPNTVKLLNSHGFVIGFDNLGLVYISDTYTSEVIKKSHQVGNLIVTNTISDESEQKILEQKVYEVQNVNGNCAVSVLIRKNSASSEPFIQKTAVGDYYTAVTYTKEGSDYIGLVTNDTAIQSVLTGLTITNSVPIKKDDYLIAILGTYYVYRSSKTESTTTLSVVDYNTGVILQNITVPIAYPDIFLVKDSTLILSKRSDNTAIVIKYIGSSLISWSETTLSIGEERIFDVVKSGGFYWVLTNTSKVYKAADLLVSDTPTFVGVEELATVDINGSNKQFFVSSGIPVVPSDNNTTFVLGVNNTVTYKTVPFYGAIIKTSVGSFNYATGEILVDPSKYSSLEYEAYTLKAKDSSTYFTIGEISWE